MLLLLGGGTTAAPFSPIDVSDLALWLDASDAATITESGGAVSAWADKSGGGNNATQGTAAAKPTTGAATINSRNVLSFDGGDYLNITDFAYAVTGQTIIAVVKHTATGSEEYIFSHSDTAGNQRAWDFRKSAAQALVHSVSTDGTFANSFLVNTTSTYTATNANILAVTWEASDTNLYFNGSEIATAGTPAASMHNSTAVLLVGARAISAVKTPTFSGQLAELLLYDRKLTDGELASVNTYLTEKWGIA